MTKNDGGPVTELERTKKALDIAVAAIHGFAEAEVISAYKSQEIAQAVHDALHPPTEYEEVEVRRFLVMRLSDNSVQSGYPTHAAAVDYMLSLTLEAQTKLAVVEVIGTYRRPKPRPVERSVSGTVSGRSPLRQATSMLLEIPVEGGYPLAGTLVTVTWTEDAK